MAGYSHTVSRLGEAGFTMNMAGIVGDIVGSLTGGGILTTIAGAVMGRK